MPEARTMCHWALILLFTLIPCVSKAQNIPDSSLHQVIIGKIVVEGNRITGTRIVLRELPFAEGDTLDELRLQKEMANARQNLLNTSLFNFVEIAASPLPEDPDKVDVRIKLTERWFIWPSPFVEIADRNFNAWVKNKDYTRLNYGLYTEWINFNGQKDILKLLLQFGRNEHFSLIFEKPYLDSRKRWGAGFEAGMLRSREVPVETVNDKIVYFSNSHFLNKGSYVAARITLRQNIYSTHLAEIRFNHTEISDTLADYNPQYYFTHEYPDAGFLSFYVKFKFDHRDIKYYPLSGWYLDFEGYKAGTELWDRKTVNYFWIKSTTRYFKPLAARWYSGASLATMLATDNLPFYYRQGLGYQRDFVRGYEYNVANGRGFILVKTNVKYAIIPEKSTQLPLIPWEQFSRIHYAAYLTAFADFGYVWQNSHPQPLNSLPGTLMAGTGIGLDFVTYYDWVMRTELSLNRNGKCGIFIHLIAGI